MDRELLEQRKQMLTELVHDILAPSAVACDKLPHRASAHRWQVVPFCVLGSSNGIS